VMEASTGAVAAVDSAQRLAAAIDAVDDTLTDVHDTLKASGRPLSARERQSRREQQTVVDRLTARRERLLARLESAYLSVQEVRVQLLEVSAAMQTPEMSSADDAGLAAVSANLDQMRRGLEELESTAAAERPPDELT
jgi:NAD/NADP transhydrogenase alpha subunit